MASNRRRAKQRNLPVPAARAPQRRPDGVNRSARGATDGQHTIVEYQEGPLPSPEQLAKYEAIIPGSANRIITMAEEQSSHRQSLEAIAVPATFKAQRLGQHYGLIATLAAITGSVILGVNGQEAASAALGGGTVVAVASVFVYGRRSQERERAND